MIISVDPTVRKSTGAVVVGPATHVFCTVRRSSCRVGRETIWMGLCVETRWGVNGPCNAVIREQFPPPSWKCCQLEVKFVTWANLTHFAKRRINFRFLKTDSKQAAQFHLLWGEQLLSSWTWLDCAFSTSSAFDQSRPNRWESVP